MLLLFFFIVLSPSSCSNLTFDTRPFLSFNLRERERKIINLCFSLYLQNYQALFYMRNRLKILFENVLEKGPIYSLCIPLYLPTLHLNRLHRII